MIGAEGAIDGSAACRRFRRGPARRGRGRPHHGVSRREARRLSVSGANPMADHGMRVAIKRIYEAPAPREGPLVLVDRLWAAGVSKEAADLDAWMKELGPSDELRTWFGHQPGRWDAFVAQYRQELATPLRQLLLAELQGVARGSPVTLAYGAHDTKENEARVPGAHLSQDLVHPHET